MRTASDDVSSPEPRDHTPSPARVGGAPGSVGSIAWQLPTPIYPDSELSVAWRHMKETDCSIAPVMARSGEYLGVVRRVELLRLASDGPPPGPAFASPPPRERRIGAASGPAATPAALEGRTVQELLTRFPYRVDRRDPIPAAKLAMDEAAIGCVPVVDGLRLVGFVTSVEVLRTFLGPGDPARPS